MINAGVSEAQIDQAIGLQQTGAVADLERVWRASPIITMTDALQAVRVDQAQQPLIAQAIACLDKVPAGLRSTISDARKAGNSAEALDLFGQLDPERFTDHRGLTTQLLDTLTVPTGDSREPLKKIKPAQETADAIARALGAPIEPDGSLATLAASPELPEGIVRRTFLDHPVLENIPTQVPGVTLNYWHQDRMLNATLTPAAAVKAISV